MNKKGLFQVAFIMPIVIGAIIIISAIAFLSSSTIRYTIIGVAVIGLTFVVGIPAALQGDFNNKKIYFLLILIGIGIFIILIPKLGIVEEVFVGATTTTISGTGDRVIITATPAKDRLVVSLSKDELNQELADDGFSVNRGVNIEIHSKKLTRIYPLVTTNTIFYTMNWENHNDIYAFDTSENRLIERCKTDFARPNTIHVFYKVTNIPFYIDLVCVEQRAMAKRAILQGEAIDEFEIQVDVTGATSKVITRTSREQTFFDGDIKVEYIGDFSAPEQIAEVPYDIQWTNGQFNFLIDKNAATLQGTAYDRYISTISSLSQSGSASAYNSNFDAITRYLTDIGAALQKKNLEFAPTLVSSINFVTETNDKGRLEASIIPSAIRIPLIRITVDGTFLGIVPLSGQPQITKVNGQCFSDVITEAGDTSNMQRKLIVKNIGNENAKFYISRMCTNNKLDVLLLSSIDLLKGSTQELGATITGASSIQGVIQEGTCTITIIDSNDASKKDSCTFGISIDFATVMCTPNEISCSEDKSKVVQCNSLGTSQKIVKTCASGFQCGKSKDGPVDCIDKSGNVPDDGGNGGGGGGGEDSSEERLVCQWYQTSSIKESKDSGLLGWRKIFNNEIIITEEKCKTDSTILLIFILGFITIIIVTTVITSKKSKKRKKR